MSRAGRRATAAALVAVALAVAAASLALALGAGDETLLVSRSSAGVKGSASSSAAAVSADGRFVAFQSEAHLHPDDTDANADVYVRDLQERTTTLISRATGAAGAKGNADSSLPSISADGRYVAFASAANLDGGTNESHLDVFVRDLQANTTTLVSRVDGTQAKGNADSTAPAISADGRYVAFDSVAALQVADMDPIRDVYRRDLVLGVTALVSRATGPAGANVTNPSELPSISGDGSRVSFQSIAGNLHPDDLDTADDIYVRDFATDTTILVSRATTAAGAKGNSPSRRSALSADGRHVAFDSAATNLDPADLSSGADVYVRDLQDSTTSLVSRGPAGVKANAATLEPSISGDGRYVTFDSVATNLDPDDTDAVRDIFVRDRQQETTTLLSRADGEGAKGDRTSDAAAVSSDGRVVAYESLATTLDADDSDAIGDVFVRAPDRTPPVLTVPAAITTQATGPAGATVTYAATAADNVDGDIVPSCSPPPGATFAEGANTVTCSAVDQAGNSATAQFGVTVTPQPVTPPPPPPPPPPPAPPSPVAPGPLPQRSSAQLVVRQATIDRARRLLIVAGSVSRLASGAVTVELRSAGRRLRFSAPIGARGRIDVRRRIAAAQAALQSGALKISYAGDADTRARTVRLRAGSRRPALRARRATLAGNRLRAGGTTAAVARGAVRVELEYVLAGQARTRAFSARIVRGRWKIDVRLSAPVLAEISQRTGPLHAYTLFAGYGPRRVGGQLLYAQLLG